MSSYTLSMVLERNGMTGATGATGAQGYAEVANDWRELAAEAEQLDRPANAVNELLEEAHIWEARALEAQQTKSGEP